MFMSRMSVMRKMWVCFSVLIFGIMVMTVSIYINGEKVKAKTVFARENSLKYALLAEKMKRDIIEVQHWLTDVSATKMDDGFKEAQTYAESFRKDAAKFRSSFLEGKNQEMIAEIDSIMVAFDQFYETGKRMATVYISEGTESGNILMEKFDPYAESLNSMVDRFVKEHTAELVSGMESIEKSSKKLSSNMLLLGMLVLAIGATLAVITSYSIRKPLQTVLSSIERIGSGDLTVRINLESQDEFGKIGKSVDKMTESLKSTMQLVNSSALSVSQSSSNLSASSTQLVSSTEELTANASTVASITTHAKDNINAISSAAEQMSSSANSVATAIEEMSASIMEVAKNCHREVEIAQEANHHAQASKETMDRLTQAAISIGQVVTVIKKVADQTNLLALNATIEAASAGEAGRGFAVVASEVKELARQTASATLEIENQIKGIQDSTRSAAKSIEQVTEVFEEVASISQTIVSAVEEQSATVNEISKNVGFVNIGARDVATNVAESAGSLNEVASTTQVISSAIYETSTGISQVNTAAKELEKISQSLKSSVGKFKIKS